MVMVVAMAEATVTAIRTAMVGAAPMVVGAVPMAGGGYPGYYGVPYGYAVPAAPAQSTAPETSK
jgi:hypothetical protein